MSPAKKVFAWINHITPNTFNIDYQLSGEVTGCLGQRVMHPRQPHILTLDPTDLWVLMGQRQEERTLGISAIITIIYSLFIYSILFEYISLILIFELLLIETQCIMTQGFKRKVISLLLILLKCYKGYLDSFILYYSYTHIGLSIFLWATLIEVKKKKHYMHIYSKFCLPSSGPPEVSLCCCWLG